MFSHGTLYTIEELEEWKNCRVAITNAYVWKEATTLSQWVDQLKDGDVLFCRKVKDEDWYKVYNLEKELYGYMQGRDIELLEEETVLEDK